MAPSKSLRMFTTVRTMLDDHLFDAFDWFDFEGALSSAGTDKVFFTRIAGDVAGQPVPYAATDSKCGDGGGFLFRTDFDGASKVGNARTGTFASSQFLLGGQADISFDCHGTGGFVALCLGSDGSNCKRVYCRTASTTMVTKKLSSSLTRQWVGRSVHFRLVDDQTGGFLAVDNIFFSTGPSIIPTHPLPPRPPTRTVLWAATRRASMTRHGNTRPHTPKRCQQGLRDDPRTTLRAKWQNHSWSLTGRCWNM